MEIVRERISTTLTQSAGKQLWSELSQSYNSAIHGIHNDVREKVGLTPVDSKAFYRGDIFFTDAGQLLFYQYLKNENCVETGSLINSEEESPIYIEFRDKVHDVLNLQKSGKHWEPVPFSNKQFDLIKQEASILKIDKKEMNAAFEMKDDGLRNLLRTITEKGSCFQDDILKGPGDFETPTQLAKLEELGLISKEFFIFCHDTGQQISRVNSLAALEDARDHGFKCFSCGRLISEERISPQIKPSELGLKFSQSNYWLALHLIYILGNMGNTVDEVAYKTEKENRVFDLFYNVMDQFLMFEVKDEPIKLEEMFLFLSRINFYKPISAIMMSSHEVSPEVNLYLKNYEGDIPLILIEGFDDLESKIARSFENINNNYQKELFRQFGDQTPIRVMDLFTEKYFAGEGKASEMPEKIEEEIPEEETPAVTELIEGIGELIPGADLNALPAITGEIPGAFQTMEILPDMTIQISPEHEEEIETPETPGETFGEEEAQEKVLETAEEIITEEMEKQKEEAAEEFVIDFMESLPTEVLPVDELSMGIDTSEEDLDNQSQAILQFIKDEGIAGNSLKIREELEKINDIGLYSSVVVDTTGLVISNDLAVTIKAAPLAAYSAAIVDNIQNFLEESGMAKAQSIHLEGKTGRIKIYPGENASVVAYEERKAGDYEDEGGMLPGETVLREAILKKVLENLSKTDGIVGSVIAGRDGLIIETNLPSSLDSDTLGYLSSMVINENERYLEVVEGGPIRQILIKTSETFYNIIPIEAEGIFTTCLDPYIPREVWQSQLPQSAMMIKSALS